MEWDPNLRGASPGNWWRGRSTSVGHGRRFIDNEHECATSTPYYQMGEPRKGGWIGMWKRILRRSSKKKKAIESDAAAAASRTAPSYDPCTYMQNFDRGSARMEPENLARSFSSQFANPSGFLQRTR